MDQSKQAIIEKKIQKTIAGLERNNMSGYYVAKKEDVAAKVAELLREGETVATGGSMSLVETGVMDLLRSGNYQYLDRERGTTQEERDRIQREAFFADTYLCSSNAVTESGKLYNVDGNGNRVAALIFGPKSVIVVAGYNKLCKDIDKAAVRVKSVAAPANCVRLGCDTYCHERGECIAFSKDEGDHISSGCSSDTRICCTYVITARQRIKGRIKVILVGEEIGY